MTCFAAGWKNSARTADFSGSLDGGTARQEQTLGPHVIATQLPQSVGYEFGGDPLAPGHVKVRIVERLGDARSECSGLRNRFLIQGSALQAFCRLSGEQ